ncbi:histone deacetylase [Actinomadura logoneensis]|uniref:Histone deacetylase n=1 Tax=Actinomadura logoneensis TaxID=2293572 RepID=A0A372JHC2_9ACTN|nr:histone deacetylase [Actinomadura logoneensis]RFU39403.1 histone deacetylase [Actinomadura logoneensis]
MKLWYVAYGSNLHRDRFLCYLRGGRPAGAARTYTGCRDPRPPAADRPVLLPGGVYFALTSLVWGGGMAFYDPDLADEVPARAYLLSSGQFCDVLAQEMRRDPGAEPDLTPAFGANGRRVLGPGRYETVLNVGELDGHPMLTFTSPHGAADAELNAPSDLYLTMLATGLRESHGWTPEQATAYLMSRPGALGTVRP